MCVFVTNSNPGYLVTFRLHARDACFVAPETIFHYSGSTAIARNIAFSVAGLYCHFLQTPQGYDPYQQSAA